VLVYAGIDEAGYGPMLGPLCVATTAFVLDDDDAEAGAPNLWARLRSAVCRSGRDKRRRVAVDDSKKLKGARKAKTAHPLRHLERGVLAFGRCLDADDADDDRLFDALGVSVPDRPWYRSRTPLPVAQAADELRIAASRVRRGLERAGVRCAMMRCEAIDAEGFNAGVARMGRKSDVNFGAAMRGVNAVWSRWPDAHPRVIVDRQGGRTHYREELQLMFPGSVIQVIAESEAISRYRLDRDGARMTISFARCAEDGHLPVALASMTAKYVRELLMLRLNRFFLSRLPEVKPTAGYVEDARRYLRDIEPVVRELGVDRSSLVRAV
jgi:ribonuclease HII